MKVNVGSILYVKADALVNAANEALSHGAGVALAISDAAGREFDEECQRKLRLKGSLKTTQVLATRPGDLKTQFKYILNAVGPIWSQYSDKTLCLSDLHDTIVNILNEAENLHVRTLVMPAISCGKYGLLPSINFLQRYIHKHKKLILLRLVNFSNTKIVLLKGHFGRGLYI